MPAVGRLCVLACLVHTIWGDAITRGYCGGSFEDVEIKGFKKKTLRLLKSHQKSDKEPNPKDYKHMLEKDVPTRRPNHLHFKMKVWHVKQFVTDHLLSQNNIKTQYDRVMGKLLPFFNNLFGVYSHNQTHQVNVSGCIHRKENKSQDVIYETSTTNISLQGFDYHMVINAGDESACGEGGGVLAFAQTCAGETRQSQSDGKVHRSRPLIGLVYMCKGMMSGDKLNDFVMLQTIKHEVFHTMGVTSSILKRPPYNLTTYIPWATSHGMFRKQITYTTNPLTKEAAQLHFNCSTVPGAELEGTGVSGGGTAGSHWELRVFGPVLMSGLIHRKNYLSNITVSFLRALLWYDRERDRFEPWYPWVNVSMVETSWYGHNEGCDFATKSCKVHIDKESKRDARPRAVSFPFASHANLRAYLNYRKYMRTALLNAACSPNRLSVLTCAIDHQFVIATEEEQLKTLYYTGYQLDTMRGVSQYTEYCPIYSDVVDGSRDTYCQNPSVHATPKQNHRAELFGAQSLCFEQEVPFTQIDCEKMKFMRVLTSVGRTVVGFSGAGCYQYKCEHGRLHVQAAGAAEARYSFKVCWAKDTVISIRRMIDRLHFVHGKLICPACEDVCGTRFCQPPVHDLLPRDQLNAPCFFNAATSTKHINITLILLVMFLNILIFV